MQPFFGQLDKYFQPKLLYMISIGIFEGKTMEPVGWEIILTMIKLVQRLVVELNSPTSSSVAARSPDLEQLVCIKVPSQSSTLSSLARSVPALLEQ